MQRLGRPARQAHGCVGIQQAGSTSRHMCSPLVGSSLAHGAGSTPWSGCWQARLTLPSSPCLSCCRRRLRHCERSVQVLQGQALLEVCLQDRHLPHVFRVRRPQQQPRHLPCPNQRTHIRPMLLTPLSLPLLLPQGLWSCQGGVHQVPRQELVSSAGLPWVTALPIVVSRRSPPPHPHPPPPPIANILKRLFRITLCLQRDLQSQRGPVHRVLYRSAGQARQVHSLVSVATAVSKKKVHSCIHSMAFLHCPHCNCHASLPAGRLSPCSQHRQALRTLLQDRRQVRVLQRWLQESQGPVRGGFQCCRLTCWKGHARTSWLEAM